MNVTAKMCTFFLVLILSICSIELCSAEAIAQQEEQFPIVKTNLGEIRGRLLKSRLGQSFLAFRGVRYAEAPIDELRFQPPVPVKPWNDIYEATEDGPMCVQSTQTPDEISEDCLRLNIYTRNVSSSRKRPVIIYFHPGGFYGLSSQSKTVAGPQNFMDRDIVLVTANYRLGILGFLSTGTKEAAGNNGLKDQVQVFKFVQQNIDKFGGDHDSVTLMGYSAGAMSITMHLVSPMSQGLFHRAIVMSGSATSQWEIPFDQMDLARKQAHLLNCTNESVESIMDCLRKADKIAIANSTPKMFEFGKGDPIILFKPVIERDFGQERFLTQNPTCLFRQGRFQKVNILTGITQFEFLYPAVYVLRNSTLRNQMSTEFQKYAPISFLYERNTSRSSGITSKLKAHFFNSTGTSDENWLTFDGLKDLYADAVIGFGAHRFVQLASVHTKVYHYKFSYNGRFSHTYYPADKPYGAVHHDELLYLLRVPKMTPPFKETDPENTIIEQLTGWWANFAETGNPNEGEFTSPLVWEPSTSDTPKYLEINDSPKMGSVLFPHRYDIWESLFPIEDKCQSINV